MMAALLFRSFARRVAKVPLKPAGVKQPAERPAPEPTPPPPKPKSAKKTKGKATLEDGEFPSELRKVGLSKKDVDEDFITYFRDLKKKGLPEHIGKLVGDRLAKGETAEEIVDSFMQREIKQKREPQRPPPQAQPSTTVSPPKPPSSMPEIKLPISSAAEEKLSQYMKQFQVSAHIEDTASKKKDLAFREQGKADLVKAYEEEGKYTGPIHGGGEKGDSKIRHEVEKNMKPTDLEVLNNPGLAGENPTEFQKYMLDLTPAEKTHLRYELENDEANLRKAKRLREKIKQKRAIRDKYSEFQISLHEDDKAEKDKTDLMVISTENNVKNALAEILNSPKTGINTGMLEGGFISVLRIQSNTALTVMNVFYSVFKPEFELVRGQTTEKKSLRESVRRKLIHAKGFVASQLVRKIGLKFAPEIRFIPYVLGAPPRQIIDPKAVEETESNSELFVRLAEIDDERHITPRLPSKYTVRKVKFMEEKGSRDK